MQKGSLYETKPASSQDGSDTLNIECVMIEIIIKPLVQRLIDMKSDLTSQENLVI